MNSSKLESSPALGVAPSQSPNHPSFYYIYLLQMNPRGAETSVATSRSPGFHLDTLIANLSSPAFILLLGQHQAGIASIHTQESSKEHSPDTLMQTPHSSRGDALSSSETANINNQYQPQQSHEHSCTQP